MKQALFILTILMILTAGCEMPKEFQGFKWDVDLTVPLMNKTYPIYDLEDGENFIIEDSLLVLFYNNEMESEEAASNLKLKRKSSETRHIYASEEGTYVAVPIDESGIDDEDIEVTYALISQGIIKIELSETIPELHELTIVFLDIITPDGHPFQTTIYDVRDSIYIEDITTCHIGSLDGEVILDSLSFHVTTVNDDTDTKLSNVRIFFDESLYFEYFRGYMTNKKVAMEEQIFDSNVNYPYNISNAIHLQEALLQLSFRNELGFDALFEGEIKAVNYKDNKEQVLRITKADNIVFRRADVPGASFLTQSIIERPELVSFLNVYPEKLIMTNSHLTIGNIDNTIGFASDSNKNFGSFQLSTPSIFTVNNSTIVPDTVYVVKINEENREYIEKYPQNVILSFVMENTTPLGATVDLFLSSSQDTLHIFGYDVPDDVLNVTFFDNYIGPALGSGQGLHQVEFSMTREDIELFLREQVYFAMKITFDKSEGALFINPAHHIKIIGRLNILVRIDL